MGALEITSDSTIWVLVSPYWISLSINFSKWNWSFNTTIIIMFSFPVILWQFTTSSKELTASKKGFNFPIKARKVIIAFNWYPVLEWDTIALYPEMIPMSSIFFTRSPTAGAVNPIFLPIFAKDSRAFSCKYFKIFQLRASIFVFKVKLIDNINFQKLSYAFTM